MDSSVGLECPVARPGARRPALAYPARRAVHWFLALPDHLGAAITIVAAFSAIVLGIAAVYGAPLSMPRERISAALGLHAALPVAFAIVFYVALRAFKVLTGRQTAADPPLARTIAVDMTLMALFITVTYFHFSLKTWVQVINPALYDEAYFAVDRQMQPLLDLFYWIRANIFSLMPNADALYQAAFLLMFIVGFCSLAVTRSPYYPQFSIAVLLTMSLGALSYLPAPALGPFIYEEGLNKHATQAQAAMLWAHKQAVQHGMPWIAKAGPAYFTGALSAMPSLHIAHGVAMTYFMARAGSPMTIFFLLICFWVLIESVASRWHYLIDLPVGLALAAFVICLTNRICRDKARQAGPAPDAAALI